MPNNEQETVTARPVSESDFSSVLFASFLKALILAAFVWVVYAVVPSSSHEIEKTTTLFVFPADNTRPENHERVAYLGILLLFLPLSWILNRNIRTISSEVKIATWSVAGLLVLLIWTKEAFFYFEALSSPFVLPCLGLLCFGLQRSGRLNNETFQKCELSRNKYWLCAALFIFAHFWIRWIPENNGYWLRNHCEAILFANWQTFCGKTLTFDVLHQYGLYPAFLNVIWQLFGKFSLTGFSVTMSLVVAVYHYCLFYFAAKYFKRRLLGFFVVAGTIQFSSLFGSTIFEENATNFDPYFQYTGVRTFFPGLLLYFMAKLPEKPTFCRTVLFTIALSFAPFWNLDTGLVCVGSWFIFLVTQQKSWLRPLLLSFLSVVFCGLLLVGYFLCKSGHVPDFFSMLRYQIQFYGLGFFMLPMPLVHSWLIYAMVSVFSAGVYFRNPHPERGVFLSLAVLSAGIFAYYQGRSHPAVFCGIIFPAALLLGLGIDRLPFQKTLPQSVATWLYSMTLAVSALTIIFLTVMHGSVFRPPKGRIPFVTASQQDTLFANSIKFLHDHSPSGKTVWILSNNASVYHVLSRTVSPLQCSLIETFKRSEIETILHQLSEQKEVFADDTVLKPGPNEINPILLQMLKQHLTENFVEIQHDADGRLSLWKRR